jgi:hypothetical protein
MKKTSNFRGLLAISALALSVLAMPAAAQTAPSTTTDPTTPTTSCGTICPDTTLWTVAGQAASGGIGESTFTGTTGTNKVEKRGWSLVDITMNGSGCATIDCTTGASNFSAVIKAGEEVHTETTAAGNVSGQTVSAVNGSQAVGIGQLQLQMLRGPITVPTTHTAN